MTVYVVNGNQVEIGQFKSFKGESVYYMTEDGLKMEHTRNVFFKKINAQYHNLQQFGIIRPVLNGHS